MTWFVVLYLLPALVSGLLLLRALHEFDEAAAYESDKRKARVMAILFALAPGANILLAVLLGMLYVGTRRVDGAKAR